MFALYYSVRWKLKQRSYFSNCVHATPHPLDPDPCYGWCLSRQAGCASEFQRICLKNSCICDFCILGSNVYNCLCKCHWLKCVIFPQALASNPWEAFLVAMSWHLSAALEGWVETTWGTYCNIWRMYILVWIFLGHLLRYVLYHHEWVVLVNGIYANRKTAEEPFFLAKVCKAI